MNMKRNKKIIGISCFVLLLLVGIIYGYMHSINIYRLEVTQIEGSGYGYKIYERERLIIVQPFIPVVSGKRPFQSVKDAKCIGWWHCCANTMAQTKALSTDYFFSSSLGATT